jgi:hypothetical protein
MLEKRTITPLEVAINTIFALKKKNALEDTAFIRQAQGGYDGSHSFYLPKLHQDLDQSISDQVETYKNQMLWKYAIGVGVGGALALAGALIYISKVLSQPH